MSEEKPQYHGHRVRLRQRLLQKGGESLADYEVLECLLFGAKPRGDVKPLAKALIARFGPLGAVLSAAPHDPQKVTDLVEAPTVVLKAARLAIDPPAVRVFAATDFLEAPGYAMQLDLNTLVGYFGLSEKCGRDADHALRDQVRGQGRQRLVFVHSTSRFRWRAGRGAAKH